LRIAPDRVRRLLTLAPVLALLLPAAGCAGRGGSAAAGAPGPAADPPAGGDEPASLVVEPIRTLAQTLAGRAAPFRSTLRVLPSQTHTSTPVHGTIDALEWLFAGWATPDSLYDVAAVEGTLDPLDAHRAGLARVIGLPSMAGPEQVSNTVFTALGLARAEAAVRLAREGTRRYPGDAGTRAELADALDAAGDGTGTLSAQVEDASGNRMMEGIDALRGTYGQLFQNSPDLRAEVTTRIRAGEFVIDEERASGMNLPGMPPELHAAIVYRVRGGRIVHVRLLV
jgi:hypothetical protein